MTPLRAPCRTESIGKSQAAYGITKGRILAVACLVNSVIMATTITQIEYNPKPRNRNNLFKTKISLEI